MSPRRVVALAATLALALAATLPLAALPNVARADHTEERRELDYTAYTLHKGEVRAGLVQTGVGLLDGLQVETTIPIWVLAATYKAAAPNLHVKWKIFERRGVALGVRAGFSYAIGNDTFTADDQLRLWVIPIHVPLSWRIDPTWTLSLTTTISHMIANGNVSLPLFDIGGDTVGDNVQFSTLLEYRVDRRFELQVHGNMLVHRSDAVLEARSQLSSSTRADLSVGVARPDFSGAVEVIGAYSWKKLELRAGVGWGSFFAFQSGLVMTRRTPYPVFDIYYRY